MSEFGNTPAPKKGLGARGVFIIIILIVAGIFTMFYMRAYFFGPRRPAPAGRDARPNPMPL